jgi:hypothetical protein
MWLRRVLSLTIRLAVLVLATRPRPALADAVLGDTVEANSLFYQGKSLMDAGRVAEACQKLSESLSIRRRGGTLLNLAVCRATEGRYATALTLFEEALDLAERDGRAGRRQFARTQIDDARSKLSWLTITLAPHAAVAGLRIQCDGEALAPGTWGTARAIDAGRHTISAAAPGMKAFEATVLVAGPGDSESVEIPTLAPEPPPAPVAAAPKTATPTPTATLALHAAIVAPQPLPRPSLSTRFVHNRPALVLTAATVVLASFFGYFAWQTVEASNEVSHSFTPENQWNGGSPQEQGRRSFKLEIASGVGALLTGIGATWLTFRY